MNFFSDLLVLFSSPPVYCFAFRTPVCELALGFFQGQPVCSLLTMRALPCPVPPSVPTSFRNTSTNCLQVSLFDLPRAWGLLDRSVAHPAGPIPSWTRQILFLPGPSPLPSLLIKCTGSCQNHPRGEEHTPPTHTTSEPALC